MNGNDMASGNYFYRMEFTPQNGKGSYTEIENATDKVIENN